MHDAWRYVWNNLRLAIAHAGADHRAVLDDNMLDQVQQVHDFMGMLGHTSELWAGSWHQAAPLARGIFQSFRPWLESYVAGTSLRVPRANTGVRFPTFMQRSLQVSTDGETATAVTLANGVRLPVLGLGVWQMHGTNTRQAVLWALEAGYRHIDTALGYGNEKEVGAALKESSVPREEITLVTKLSDPGAYRSQARVRFMQQLEVLGVDYIDVYMLHSPGYGKEDREAAWRQLEQLYDEGKIKALGVSNFNIEELEELFAFARVKPVYIQNKYSIYQPGYRDEARTQQSIMEWLNEHKVVMTGYSIIHPAHDGLLSPLSDPHVQAMARRVGRTPSQVLHRWLLQLGVVVIPKSIRKERIVENSQLFDFALADSDVRLLNGLASLVAATPKALAPGWCEDVYGLASLAA